VAYRDENAGEVLEAPTAEGVLRVELTPHVVRLSIGGRSLEIDGDFATLIEHRRGDRRTAYAIAGRLVVARDVPHEDLAIWIEIEPNKKGAGMRRLFGVAPVSLLEPNGLAALAALDKIAQRLRIALGGHAHDIRRSLEIGRGADKVLLADHGDRYVIYARRLFSARARVALTIHDDGRVAVAGAKTTRDIVVRSRFGVDVIGDYIRFTAPDGEDLARVSIPWINADERRELARRIGQLVDRPDEQTVPDRA
jgi:hypothetical protein